MRDLEAQTSSIELADGTAMSVYGVSPANSDSAAQPLPAVIVIHDILGFTADTRRICQRLATGPMPLVVAAPDLYAGLGPKPLCVVRTIKTLKRGEGPTFDRLAAVQKWLSCNPVVDNDRTAVVGFCMGGGFAILYSARATVAVVAPFYGDVPMDVEAIRNICPVVGGYGERDRIFAPQGHRLADHLETLQVDNDVKFYPDAGHSYMNQLTGLAKLGAWTPMRAAYDEPAAEDSWQRVFAFFQKHL